MLLDKIVVGAQYTWWKFIEEEEEETMYFIAFRPSTKTSHFYDGSIISMDSIRIRRFSNVTHC